MSNIINLPVIIYPKYSDHYFAQKKKLEARIATEMKELSDFQPFYEQVVAVLSKYKYDRPVQMNAYTSSIIWTITLTAADSLSVIEPMMKELYSSFGRTLEAPYACDWERYLSWSIYQSRQRADGGYTSSMNLYLKVFYPEAGLKDMPVAKTTRTTTSTIHIPAFTNPFWSKEE